MLISNVYSADYCHLLLLFVTARLSNHGDKPGHKIVMMSDGAPFPCLFCVLTLIKWPDSTATAVPITPLIIVVSR